MIFGYMRISTSDKQKTDRQKLILQEYSEKNNFIFDELNIPSGQKYECTCPKCKTLLFRKAI